MKRDQILNYCIFLPIILMAVLLYFFSVNSAHWDDHAVKYSVKNIIESTSLIEQLQLLFKQHNEHRIVVTRLVALLSKAIFGYLDYRLLMVFGFLFLIGIALLISKLNIKNEFKLIGILLLINPSFHENSFWGMASVQNFGVVFFAVLTAKFVSKKKIFLAFLMATITIFTSANGIVVLIATALFYLIFREFKNAIIWISLSLMLLFAFYFNLKPNEDLIKTDIKNIINIQKGFFVLSGSVFDSFFIFSSKRLIINYIIGFVLVFPASIQMIFWILKKKTSSNESFFFILFLFILGTIAGTVLSRLGYGIEIMLTSKYKIYSALLLILNLYLLILKFPKIINSVLLGTFFVFGLTYLFDYQKVKNLKQERLAEYFNSFYSTNKELKDLWFMQEPAEINNLIQGLNLKSIETNDSLELKKINQNYVIKINPSEPFGGSYVLLQNDSLKYVFPINPKILGYKSVVKNVFFENKEGIAHIPESSIKSGNYQIKVISKTQIKNFQKAYFQGIVIENKKKNW